MKAAPLTIFFCVFITILSQANDQTLLDVDSKGTIQDKINRISVIKKTLNELKEYRTHVGKTDEIKTLLSLNRLMNDYRVHLICICLMGITFLVIISLFIHKAKREASFSNFNNLWLKKSNANTNANGNSGKTNLPVYTIGTNISAISYSFNDNEKDKERDIQGFTFGEMGNLIEEDPDNIYIKDDNTLNLSYDDRNDLERIIDCFY